MLYTVKTLLKSPLSIKQFSTEYLTIKNQRIRSWQSQSIQTIQWTNQTRRGKHSRWRKAQENVCVRVIISFGFASYWMTMVGDHSLSVVMQLLSILVKSALYESANKDISLNLTSPQSSSHAWHEGEQGVMISLKAPTSPRSPRAVWDCKKVTGDQSVCLKKTSISSH